MTTTPPPRRRTLADRAARIARTLLYTFLALMLGALGFSLVITLLALGAGTVVIWVGLPLLVTAVLVARLFAGTERGLQTVLLGSPLPAPRAVQASAGAGAVRRMLTPLTDPQRWLDSLWVLVNFLLSLITFPILLTWTLGALATACGPLATLILDRVLEDPGRSGFGELLGMSGPLALTVDIAVQIAIGLMFLLTLDPVARGLASLRRGVGRGVGRGLLSSRFEEQERLARTEESRAAGRSAESTALRSSSRSSGRGSVRTRNRPRWSIAGCCPVWCAASGEGGRPGTGGGRYGGCQGVHEGPRREDQDLAVVR